MAEQTLIEQFRRSLSEECRITEGERAIAGLSGGVDSVVLVHLLKEVGVDLHVVHVNYGLRGAESNADEGFAVALCDRLMVPCTVVRPPAGWSDHASGSSLQEWARDFRYETFENLAKKAGATKVVVGHHQDDQVETVLLRLIRGTGLRGLGGMRPRRPISEASRVELVRPLLFITRPEILRWASDRAIQFREDRSNEDPAFDRARLRSQVIPSIAEAFGEAGLRNIARSATQAQTAFEAGVAERLSAELDAVTVPGDNPNVSVDALMALEPGWRNLVLLEAARRWIPGAPERATIANEIARLLEAQPGKRLVVAGSEVWRGRGTITFVVDQAGSASPSQNVPGDSILVPGRPVDVGSGILLVDEAVTVDDDVLSTLAGLEDPFTELVDEQIFQASVSVGRWQAGEQFRPLGMTGRKNISDFLTDQKVEPHRKSDVLVVRSGDEVVWVVGHRLEHRFRIRPDSRRAVKLRFLPG